MIKNEREYNITRASIVRFEKSLLQLAKLQDKRSIDLPMLKLQEAANKSILEELKEQIAEYDRLKKSKFKLSVFDSINSIPSNLIRARIAFGWTQRELAKRLGTTEQQVQKYEASDYESASLRKIMEIVNVLKQEQRHI